MATCHIFEDCSQGLEKSNQGMLALLKSAVLRPVWSLRCSLEAPRAKASVITAHALKHRPGWQGVDPFDLSVKHSHGLGGSSCFKILAPRGKSGLPLQVAVHMVPKHKAIAKARIEDASAIFSSHGLAPQRLAQGDTWYIEAWEGCGHPDIHTSEFFNELGALLAKIHTLPTSWFDVHRTQLLNQHPALQGVPHGSHAWCFIEHGRGCFDELNADVLGAILDPALVAPKHPIASQIVTSHCDLHGRNMLKTDGQAMCIDLETACVTYAVFDLALGMGIASFIGEMGKRQVLIQSYLEALGEQFEPEDVEELVFEAEMARACYLHGVLQPGGLKLCPEQALGVISAMKDFVSRARASPSLRAKIIELGFRRCAEEDALFKAAARALNEAQEKRVHEIVGGGSYHNGDEDEASSSPPDDAWGCFGLPAGLPIFPEANLARL